MKVHIKSDISDTGLGAPPACPGITASYIVCLQAADALRPQSQTVGEVTG